MDSVAHFVEELGDILGLGILEGVSVVPYGGIVIELESDGCGDD